MAIAKWYLAISPGAIYLRGRSHLPRHPLSNSINSPNTGSLSSWVCFCYGISSGNDKTEANCKSLSHKFQQARNWGKTTLLWWALDSLFLSRICGAFVSVHRSWAPRLELELTEILNPAQLSWRSKPPGTHKTVYKISPKMKFELNWMRNWKTNNCWEVVDDDLCDVHLHHLNHCSRISEQQLKRDQWGACPALSVLQFTVSLQSSCWEFRAAASTN